MNITLHEIRLLKSNFLINDGILEEGKEYSIQRELTISISSDDDLKTLKVELRVRNKNEDSPFYFDISYQGFFQLEGTKQPARDEIDKIGAINCAGIIFPYVREHLADLTRRAGLPPFHLPPVNFVKEYKAKRKESVNL